MRIRNFDGSQLFAFFLKNLDAHIDALEVDRIVGDLLDVEVDGGRSGGFGVGGHLEFFVGRLLELGEQEGRRCEGEKQWQVAHKSGNPHESFLWRQTIRGL